MKTNIKECALVAIKLPEFDSEGEDIEDTLSAFFGEANGCDALEFFSIEFDAESDEIVVPDTLDLDVAYKIVEDYLEYQESDGDVEYTNLEAKEYDEFTADSRGADDGTFDYCGTYVMSILEILQIVRKNQARADSIERDFIDEI